MAVAMSVQDSRSESASDPLELRPPLPPALWEAVAEGLPRHIRGARGGLLPPLPAATAAWSDRQACTGWEDVWAAAAAMYAQGLLP